MELGLSLGDASKPFGLLDKNIQNKKKINNGGLDFCMSLGLNSFAAGNDQQTEIIKARHKSQENDDGGGDEISDDGDGSGGDAAHLQLNLAPVVVLPRRWSSDNVFGPSEGSSENGASSAAWGKRDSDAAGNEASGGSSRASDDDDNGVNARKKLRLSKEQSAFLEESFKEHSTLNPKQKQALAKQLNLRPRQVEVWFQNRRARTKLKQTEVDCEYLKRCCETLTVENRRLHKELQELRALKTTSSNPFYQQLPATTLTMCPSCERVATTTASAAAAVSPPTAAAKTAAFPLISRPIFYPFSQTPTHTNKPAAS